MLFGKQFFWIRDDAGQQKFAALQFFGKVKRAGNSGFAVYSKRYQEAVETLYKVFQDNRIPWQTVHTGIWISFMIFIWIFPQNG